MKKLNINLPYRLREGGDPITNQQVTQNYIVTAVHSAYSRGLDNSQRRIFGRLLAKLDDAIDKDALEVELEQAELDLIKNAIKDAKFPAPMAYNANLLEDEIGNIKGE